MSSAVVLMSVASSAWAAQHEGHQMPGTAGTAAPEQIAACGQNSQLVTATLDAANTRIEEARQSNSASAMRAAVADFQVTLAQMKTQLAECVSLQGASNMPGMAGMDHSKMNMATTASAAAPEAAPSSAGAAGAITIAFRSQPTPARTGENQFEVTVSDKDGKPIADAEVSLAFYMPAMPAMKMPAMRNTVKLSPAGNGVYRGDGSVMMAGAWDVTVSVRRGQQELGSKKVTLNAR
jgi:hypothetical protein